MAFHHLRICHTKETSELCLSLTLLPVARYRYCPSHYIVRVLIALYDDDDDDLPGYFVVLLRQFFT